MSELLIRTAVIDRYEGHLAVVFFADDLNTPVNIERQHLPRRKPKEGSYLKIEMQGDTIVSITIDREATKAARKRIQSKLERLRRGDHLTDDESKESGNITHIQNTLDQLRRGDHLKDSPADESPSET